MSAMDLPKEERVAYFAARRSHMTVELDCPPGSPRPDDLIAAVIEGTGLPSREPALRFFGAYTWDYSDVDPTIWVDAQEKMKPRIEALYHAGRIRYGSW